MKLWKATFAATLGVLTFGIALAQTKTPPAINPVPVQAAKPAAIPLTDAEARRISRLEVKRLAIQARLDGLQRQGQALEDQLAQVNAEAQKAVDEGYGAHKVDQKDYQLCENPDQGDCVNAPANDLTLQPKAKKEEKK